jgi:hypothetical protein
MKKILFTLFITTFFCLSNNAQKIDIKKSWGTNICSMEGKKLKMSELVSLMKDNSKSFELVKKAKSNFVFSSILGFSGGALIGWPLGTAAGGGDPNWTLAGIGAGLAAISIPINNKYNRNIKAAVENYNSELAATSHYQFQPKLELKPTFNGLGMALIF